MKVRNKKASFEYQLTDNKYEAGIVLLGAEAKAIRNGHIDINKSVVRVLNGEIYLLNADIPILQPPKNYNSTRSRKLLLSKNEIITITTKTKQQKLTIVPVSVYNHGRLFKLELALGKPKKKFEKKESIKKKDIEREFEREFRIK